MGSRGREWKTGEAPSWSRKQGRDWTMEGATVVGDTRKGMEGGGHHLGWGDGEGNGGSGGTMLDGETRKRREHGGIILDGEAEKGMGSGCHHRQEDNEGNGA